MKLIVPQAEPADLLITPKIPKKVLVLICLFLSFFVFLSTDHSNPGGGKE